MKMGRREIFSLGVGGYFENEEKRESKGISRLVTPFSIDSMTLTIVSAFLMTLGGNIV